MAGRKTFISRNYKHSEHAGSIARRDIEMLAERFGGVNIGLKRSFYKIGIIHGLRNYLGLLKAMMSIRKGDVLLIEYPMKLYYDRICRIAKKKGAKVISLLIDLSAFREKCITPQQEIDRLNMCDVVLTHNKNMRDWLISHGLKTKMIDYVIMDFIHGESAPPHEVNDRNYSLYYVGNLSSAHNGFLYQLA